jgi:ribose transport system substrate-binding protein
MKMNQYLPLSLWIAIGLVLAAPGCGRNNDGQTPSAGGAPAKKLRLAFVPNSPSDFWAIARRGCEDAQKELGNVEVDFRIPSSGSTVEQQQILNDLLVRGIDGIAVSPVDSANETEFLNRVAARTLLVCTDSDAPDSKRACYIGTDNVAAGVEAAKLIKEALPQGGKIMLFVGTMDAQNAKERTQGIQQGLQGSQVEIIDIRTDETDRVRAQKNVEDTLVAHPEVAGLVGLWTYNGPAILRAVKAAGLTGRIKIVCFDEEDETLAGVAAGEIYGTVVQQPYEFGRQAIVRMAQYLRGNPEALVGGKQIVPTLSIRQDTVADFKAKLKKLLGK